MSFIHWTFNSRKNIQLFLNSLSHVDEVWHDKIALVIAGDGPEREFVEEARKKCKVQVITLGFCNQIEVGELLATADIGVVISNYDPSPKVINEMT